ncbi:MAG: CDP-alcohol phosphatidyltransferase family protein [Candidatus Tectomicrobia bacterium]|uniref:CDP-alcohol phosphatidyltransferase family protein n=1 Tax=Tectimicrobiota bacterium TaxID=2528274 RepID=A0A932MP22_UNCTE|nr:CDP-alcohol phosphatidyltransferase family protein [Candidatus Tectomicrobia bacterium]
MKFTALSAGIWAARGLTLARLLAAPLFALWLLRGGSLGPGFFAFYLFFPLSDLADGPLARRSGGARPLWARLDPLADIMFNAAALSAAAWTGRVGFWLPAAVLVLGGRFLWRGPEREAGAAGRAAGVLFYLMTGAVAAEAAFAGGAEWGGVLARAGDAVSLYAFMVLLAKLGAGRRRGRRTPGGGRRGRSTRSPA